MGDRGILYQLSRQKFICTGLTAIKHEGNAERVEVCLCFTGQGPLSCSVWSPHVYGCFSYCFADIQEFYKLSLLSAHPQHQIPDPAAGTSKNEHDAGELGSPGSPGDPQRTLEVRRVTPPFCAMLHENPNSPHFVPPQLHRYQSSEGKKKILWAN